MKKSELEKRLEAQELLRLGMLEKTENNDERKKLLEDIKAINAMRDMLEGRRLDNKNSWLKTLVQTGVPLTATLCLAVMGFASEQLNGNPTGFTLKWLFGRAPK